MEGPVLKAVEGGGDRGRHALDEPRGREHCRGLEEQRREGRFGDKALGVPRGRGIFAAQKLVAACGELLAHKAAIVQSAIRVEQRARVAVGRQPHLAEVEVKIATLERGEIVLPRQRTHRDGQRGSRKLCAETLCDRALEAAFLIHQQRQAARARVAHARLFQRGGIVGRGNGVFVLACGGAALQQQRELRRCAVAGEAGGDQLLAVDEAAHRAAHRGAAERCTAKVETEILHRRGRHIVQLHRAAHGPRSGAGRIEAEEVDAARGKQAQCRIIVLGGGERDAPERQCRVAPPALIDGQRCAIGTARIDIGPCAERHKVILCAGFDDGNIQQPREKAVCPRQRDDQRVRVPCLHRGDLCKARAVALRRCCAAIGRKHIVRGERTSVGEGHIAAQGKDPGEIVGRLRVQAKPGLSLRLRSGRIVKERLIEQRADGLLHAVDAGDGIERLSREVGEGKFTDPRRLACGRFVLLRQRAVPEVVRLCFVLPAAAQREREDQRERERRQPPPHRASSVSVMTAAMPPRCSPMPRCDQ